MIALPASALALGASTGCLLLILVLLLRWAFPPGGQAPRRWSQAAEGTADEMVLLAALWDPRGEHTRVVAGPAGTWLLLVPSKDVRATRAALATLAATPPDARREEQPR